MKLRILLLQRCQQIREVTEWKFRVQSACDVQLSRAFTYRLSGDLQRIVDVVRVSVRLARRAIEAAELAVDVANIRRIEMPIDVEVSGAAVLLSTHYIGQLAERVQVVGMEKGEAVIERQTLAGFYLGADVVKLDVVRKTHIPNQCLKK